MTVPCSGLPQGTGFISSVTSYVDCQAQALGSGGWAALAAPGSTLMFVLSGFLTIFIALIGYNLLLGSTMTVRSTTLAFVKIGAVFALATSWPAYRTLVYDLVVDGPAQLFGEIGLRSSVPGSDGTLLQRLDAVDQGLVRLAILGPGQAPPNQYAEVAPPPFAGFDTFALGGSRIVFLSTAIAGLAAVRVVAGLMLALGPLFIAFLLFDNTRSLFEGWVRVIVGAALASVGASLVLGLELGLIEPWLSNVLARRMAGEPLPTVSTELFVLALVFAILALAVLYGSVRLAYAFRLAPLLQPLSTRSGHAPLGVGSDRALRADLGTRADPGERSRAAAMASAIAATGWREGSMMAQPTAYGSSPDRTPEVRTAQGDTMRGNVPLGRSFSRRSGSRVSARAGRRDSGA